MPSGMTRIFTKGYVILLSFIIGQQAGKVYLLVKSCKPSCYSLSIQTLYSPTVMMTYWPTSPPHLPAADYISRCRVAAFSKVPMTPMSFAALTDSMVSLPGTLMSYREFFRRPRKKPIGRRGVTEPCNVSTSPIRPNFQGTLIVEHAYNCLNSAIIFSILWCRPHLLIYPGYPVSDVDGFGRPWTA